MRTKSLKKNRINVVNLGLFQECLRFRGLMGQLRATTRGRHEEEGECCGENHLRFYFANCKEESVIPFWNTFKKKEAGEWIRYFVTGCF